MKLSSVLGQFNTLPIKLVALGAIITALVTFHYVDKGYAVLAAKNATETRLNASYAQAMVKQSLKAKKVEEELSDSFKDKDTKKNEQIKQLNGRVASLIDSLRNRPNRPEDNSIPTEDRSACTGRELYLEDAAFLSGEAGRAERIRIERDDYYAKYEDARRKLDEFAKQK